MAAQKALLLGSFEAGTTVALLVGM
jgi:hypothetical protein